MKNQIKKRVLPFTQINNTLLNSTALSLKAKGLYSFMFSKPENWNFTIKSMSKQLKEGVESISSALKELKKYGWIKYNKLTNGSGIYTLNIEAIPNSENPDLGNPNLGKPVPISNKDIYNNKDSYTTTNIEKINFERAHEIFFSFFYNKNLKMEDFKEEFEKFKILNYDANRTVDNWKRWLLQIKKFNKKWGK